MGNIGSTDGNNRRRQVSRRTHPPTPPPMMPQPETTSSRYVFAAGSPYPSHYPNPNAPHYYPYQGYFPPPPPSMPVHLPNPYDHHHQAHANWLPGRYPYPRPVMTNHIPYVDHQKAVTIRNDVNLKKETLRIEPDEEHPGRFLVAFTFDATVDGSITIFFFAKEGEGCNITTTKGSLLPPVTVNFQQGLGQKFRQPSGTGIDFSMFEESELLKAGELDVYPLIVKAEASSVKQDESNEATTPDIPNSQITRAVFEKEKGEHLVKEVRQILWVNKMRYELQEIYGIGNSVENDIDGSDGGKECVICLSEPRDTTVLPCRHMCMCSVCAKMLRLQTNRCPICRQPVERLLEIMFNNKPEECE